MQISVCILVIQFQALSTKEDCKSNWDENRLRPNYLNGPTREKTNTFVDNEAQDTWECYNEKYSVDDSIDTHSGNVSGTYPRWVDHVGLKNGRVYGLGSGLDEFALHHNNDELFVRTSDYT